MASKPRSNEYIGSLRELKRRPNSKDALELLQKIASHVRPLMKQRLLRVTSVQEFYPSNPRLLGVNINHGHTIRIRLRSHTNDAVFLPFDDLIGTMIHELTHNVHGPHDAKFYKYMDAMWDEYVALITTGNFQPDGVRLGGHGATDGLSREQRLAAAERRKWINSIMMPAGGCRLRDGRGSNAHKWSEMEKTLGPARMAAMAAERRAQDRVWCGSGDAISNDGIETESAPDPHTVLNENRPIPSSSAQDPIHDVIDLTLDDDPIHLTDAQQEAIQIQDRNRNASNVDQEWICAQCTLINRPLALQCECCFAVRS